MLTTSDRPTHDEITVARSIDPETLLRWLATGRPVVVIDVREPLEIRHSGNEFLGARAIPVHQLFVRRNELPLGRAGTVVAVSNHGVRARAAAFTLSLLGCADVRVLEGGIEKWAGMGLPLA